MIDIGIGDMVINEYGSCGEVISIKGNELTMTVLNYGIEGDVDFCDKRHCFLASSNDVDCAKQSGVEEKQKKRIIDIIEEATEGIRIGVIRGALSEAIVSICKT